MTKRIFASMVAVTMMLSLMATVSYASIDQSTITGTYSNTTKDVTVTGIAGTETTSTTILALKDTAVTEDGIIASEIAYIDQMDAAEYVVDGANNKFTFTFKMAADVNLGSVMVGGTDLTTPLTVNSNLTNLTAPAGDTTLYDVTVNGSSATLDGSTYTVAVGSEIGVVTIAATPNGTSATVVYKNGVDIVTNPVTLGTFGSTTTLTIEVTDVGSTQPTIYNLVINRGKSNQITPVVSTSNITKSSITLNAIEGASYSIDNGTNWVNTVEFSGLTAGTIYTFLAKLPATETHNEAVSAPTQFTTVALSDVSTATISVNGTQLVFNENVCTVGNIPFNTQTQTISVTPAEFATYTIGNPTTTVGTASYSTLDGILTLGDQGSTTTLVITVVAENTQSNTVYTINFVKGTEAVPSNVTTLSGITLSAGTLNPVFDAAVYAYTANVGNDITTVTLTPTPTFAGAIANKNGPSTLIVGANTFTITVTAQDGTVGTPYVIIITRAAESGGTTLPAWGNTVTTNYDSGYLMKGYDKIEITPSVASAKPIVTVAGIIINDANVTLESGIIKIDTSALTINDAFPLIPSITLTFSGFAPYTVGSSPVIFSKEGYKNLLLATMPTTLSYTAGATEYTINVPKPAYDLKSFTLEATGYEETEVATNSTTIVRTPATATSIASQSTVTVARGVHSYTSTTVMTNGADKRYYASAKLLDGATEIFNKTYTPIYVPSLDTSSGVAVVTGRVVSMDGAKNIGTPVEGVIVRSFRTGDRAFAVTGPDGTFRVVVPLQSNTFIKLFKLGYTERVTGLLADTTSFAAGSNSIKGFIVSGNDSGDVAIRAGYLTGDTNHNGTVNSSDTTVTYTAISALTPAVSFPIGY